MQLANYNLNTKQKIKYYLSHLRHYASLYTNYLKKTNFFLMAKNSIEGYLKELLTVNKKLKIAKYRVNHLRYRLHQMEQLINNNNPNNFNGGDQLNCLK